jgi:nitrite reductase/ring-hydroxylating ferredoxin subunit
LADYGAPEAGRVLCRLDEIADPGSKGFSFWTGEMVFRGFVVRRGGVVKGWRHVGTPLTFGDDRYLTRDGAHLLCVTHGALFDPDTGLCVAGPCVGQSLRDWPVAVRDGAVVVADVGA